MKRQAFKQITKDDCEESDPKKRRGTDETALASEDIIKERIMKRAKLGGSDQLQSETSNPLKLFSHGFLTGKDQTLPSKDISFKTHSKSTASMMEEHSQESGCSQDKHSTANSVCSDDMSITDYPDDAFSRNISRLNTAVSKWIAAQVVKNPICDLTPIFDDYKRYFKDFNRETHPSPSSTSPVNNHSTETPCRPSQDISTVAPLMESGEKPTSTQPIGGLLFSKPSTQVHTFSAPSLSSSKITFSPTTAAESRPHRFNPLTKPSRPVASTGQISGSLKPAEIPPLKTGSLLDALFPAKSLTGKKDESSGQEAPTSSLVPSITSSVPPIPALSIPGIMSLPTSTSLPSFSFKALPLPNFAASSLLINPAKLEPPSSLFLPSVPQPTSSQAPASPEGEDGEDTQEPERPVTPPALKLDTENTIFTCRSKIFMKKSDGFSDLGISTLRVRKDPASNKTQLLVRTNASITKILINIIINSTTPLSKPREKEVMVMCPKLSDTAEKPEDNQLEEKSRIEIDTFLIRVKTEDLASTLFSLLEEAKRKLQ